MLIYTRKGELITELCFVVAGSLEVVQDGEILAFLGRLLEPSICIGAFGISIMFEDNSVLGSCSAWRDPCLSLLLFINFSFNRNDVCGDSNWKESKQGTYIYIGLHI